MLVVVGFGGWRVRGRRGREVCLVRRKICRLGPCNDFIDDVDEAIIGSNCWWCAETVGPEAQTHTQRDYQMGLACRASGCWVNRSSSKS